MAKREVRYELKEIGGYYKHYTGLLWSEVLVFSKSMKKYEVLRVTKTVIYHKPKKARK